MHLLKSQPLGSCYKLTRRHCMMLLSCQPLCIIKILPERILHKVDGCKVHPIWV